MDYFDGELAEDWFPPRKRKSASPKITALTILVSVIVAGFVVMQLLRRQPPPVTTIPSTQAAALEALDFVGQETASTILTNHSDLITSVAYSPSGQFAAGSGDGQVWLWNAPDSFEAHNNTIFGLAFNNELLASASVDGIRLWRAGQQVVYIPSESSAITFHPNGLWLANGSPSGSIHIWDVSTRQEIAVLIGHLREVQSVAFSTDGLWLASGSRDETVRIWQVATWTESAILKEHSNGVTSVAFSEAWLATGSSDHTIRVWSLPSLTLRYVLTGHSKAVRSVAFNKTGTVLASGSEDGTLRLWDLTLGTLRNVVDDYGSAVLSVAFSPTAIGLEIGVGTADGTVRIQQIR